MENIEFDNSDVNENTNNETGTEVEGGEPTGTETVTHEETMAASAEADKDEEKLNAKHDGPSAREAYIAARVAHAQALGLMEKDQKGFHQIWNGTTGHKVYIAKGGKDPVRVDTTLPPDELGDLVSDEVADNGKITCHVKPEGVDQALDLLANYGEKIRPAKKPTKQA